jgi:hypothetical protein
MEITYRLRPQDLGAFSDQQRSISPTARRADRNALISLYALWLFSAWTIWLATNAIALIVAYLLVGTIGFLFAPAGLRGTHRKQTIALYSKVENRWIFEPQTLRIEHDCLTSEAARGRAELRWEYIQRICRTDRYLFIYLSEVQAWIIPEDAVTSGDFDSFVRAADQRWQAAKKAAESNHSHATTT